MMKKFRHPTHLGGCNMLYSVKERYSEYSMGYRVKTNKPMSQGARKR
jgi:hypothetical protein